MSPEDLRLARALTAERNKALFRIVELRDEIDRLKKEAAGLTLERIAEKLDVDRSTLRKSLGGGQ